MAEKSKQQSRFSRQIFILFLLSALVPVTVLSSFAYFTISDQLEADINRQISSESRALGLTLFDRLQGLESSLRFVSSMTDIIPETMSFEWLSEMFTSLYVLEQGQVKQVLSGDYYTGISLNAKQLQHLETRTLLLLQKSATRYHFLMVQALDMDKQSYLVGVVDNSYFWNYTIKEDDFFCAGFESLEILYCSRSPQGQIIDAIIDELQRSLTQDDYYQVDILGKPYVGNDWDLFIEPQFGLQQIRFHYFIPQKAAFLDYDFYTQVFPQTILIAILMVYLLSSMQVRRSLGPLQKLTRAANNIIDGSYGGKVEVKTGNEFQVLAETFNDMSQQIDKQMGEISTMAKLDRLILSTSDTEYIVDMLLQHIPIVVPTKHISIMVLDSSSYCMARIYYNKQGSNAVEKSSLILNEDEYQELNAISELAEKPGDSKEGYLGPLLQFNIKQYVLVPFHGKEELLGCLILGQSEEPLELDSYRDSLLHLADRAAVAISNANWEQKLFRQAHYDELTALPNRFLFQDRFNQAVERAHRNKHALSLLFIDLDRFKSINDSLGHTVGDRLLQEVSKRFLQCVRSYDSVARFGGDEFVIIISDVAPELIQEKAAMLAERIINNMSSPIVFDDREFHINASIGIAIYPDDGTSYDELLKRADTAMYQAKDIPSASYQFYEQRLNIEPLARLDMENELRHALDNDQLRLLYQPKIDLRSGRTDEVEALIRWEHPKKGVISPNVFIPLAEDTGMIADIGYWVFRRACEQNKAWQDDGINLKVAVNISPDQFRQPKFYETLMGIVKETGVDPHNLELEITESIYVENHEKTTHLLNRLKDSGMAICIDDFGTGYSSMTYLQHIPVSKLKIDKSFIDNINQDKGSASIVKAIITLAHSLELRVVAEGVETRAQYVYLNAVSCDEAQGFFLSEPLPADEVIEYIASKNANTELVN